MADVKWIKLSTGIFDNRKIRQIECLPDGDSIIVIWMKLLCLAGEINDCGMVYFTREIPYTDQMLSQQFNRPLTTIQMALNTFQQFGMIQLIDNILHISNWEKYQNVEGMERIREQNRPIAIWLIASTMYFLNIFFIYPSYLILLSFLNVAVEETL